MKVQLVLLALDDHGQLTRLYSSLHSVVSSLLHLLVSQLPPHPKRLTQIPHKLARPIQRPRSPRLIHPMQYELIPHARDLSFIGIVGLCPVQLQNRPKHRLKFLR